MGVASFILSLFGMFNSFLSYFGFFRFFAVILIVLAFIFAIIGINKKQQKGLAIAGLIISIFAFLITGFMSLLSFAGSDRNNKNYYYNTVEEDKGLVISSAYNPWEKDNKYDGVYYFNKGNYKGIIEIKDGIIKLAYDNISGNSEKLNDFDGFSGINGEDNDEYYILIKAAGGDEYNSIYKVTLSGKDLVCEKKSKEDIFRNISTNYILEKIEETYEEKYNKIKDEKIEAINNRKQNTTTNTVSENKTEINTTTNTSENISVDTNTSSSNTSNSSNSSTVTFGMKNAVNKAKDYLRFMAFSEKGLKEQLEFEGYSEEEANYGVENCGADWNEQAAKKAKDYLDYMSFSRSGLIEQLEFEGFTTEQAEYGATQAGY